jgi:hypothetical protein
MHIKDHSAAMKFFRTYDSAASKGKWKEFVDEMEFDSMAQEPRTTAADGGRIGLLNGGDAVKLKAQTEFYDTYGKDVIDKASKEKHGVTFNKLKDKDKRSNFKRKFKKEFEKSGTFMTEGESRKFSRQKRVLKEQGIQIKLLEATNKEGKFNAAKFAKDNDISMKELKKQSNILQGNIYDKRMLAAGKDMGRSTLTWIPEDATISDNALIKLHKSGLIIYERNKIDELFYDAFGREYIKGTRQKNKYWNNKKYLAIKDNLNEYRQLKDAINLKYPSINFQLDHPLSKSTLNNIFNASADELTRVNVLDAELNNNFKKSLSSKYENAVSTKNLKAKKAVEKVARDLKLNIGKVSKDLTGFDYGVKEFQKLNIRDEIIKSLKNQKDLNLNFKSYIKNNPDLLKIAGYDDPSKIGTKLTKITDRQIKGVENFFNQKGSKKFLDSFTKTFQDLSPRSIAQLSKIHGCGDLKVGGSIMSCLKGKFNEAPEKFLQRAAPLAKDNVNLFKWFKNGRKIARGTGLFLAWEAAFAPIVAGWSALEGESNQRIINDIAYGIPFIGETKKEEFMREAGGDELAYKMKQMGELENQEIPYLEQQLNQVINDMAHVPGKSPQQLWIEKDIEEKKLKLQELYNTPEFYEGPAGGQSAGGDYGYNEPVIQDAYALEQLTTAKIAADMAERKKEKFDWLREKKLIADRNWQSQVPKAEGGIMNLKKKW